DQREQQVKGFRRERDGFAITQEEVFRRIQTEGAEFVDELWLLVHIHNETPPIKGSATPARKYPGRRDRATPAANHPGPNRSKGQKLRPLALNPHCWPATLSSGRQSALETDPENWNSRCTSHPVTNAANLPAAGSIPSTFVSSNRKALMRSS